MKVLQFIVSVILFASCNNQDVIHYSYNGTTITRVSEDGLTKFYYGNLDKKQTDTVSSYIKAEYFGFNNGMSIFVVFKKNNDVEFINNGDRILSEIGKKNIHVYISEYSNSIYDSVIAKYKRKYAVIRLSDGIDFERKCSISDSTKVQVEY
jgi:uncharacterized lipoprotein YajG